MRRFFLIFVAVFCLNGEVLDEANLFSTEVKNKILQISNELENKTSVKLNLASMATLKDPNLAGITLVFEPKNAEKKSGRVQIYADEANLKLFDKDAVLSPFPHKGTIIPILVSPKGVDIYNAAALNGIADIAEQVAKTKGVKLESSIGNANKATLNLMRFGIYGFLAGVVLVFLTKRIYRKKQ